MISKTIFFIFNLILFWTTIAVAQSAGREIRPLNEAWEFTRTDSEQAFLTGDFSWEKVNIPHTWNNKDMQSGPKFYAGTAWYRKEIFFEKALEGKRIFLRFEGAGQVADVYVNGQFVGNHKGSYSAFCFEITTAVKLGEKNLIHVRANNEARKDILPVNHLLFGIFGGIYRPVSLIITDRINITPTDYASPGIYIRQKNVNEQFAEISVTAKLQSDYIDRQNLTVKTTVYDKEGRVAATNIQDVIASPGPVFKISQDLRIDKPILWQGRKRPYLYKLTTEIISKGRTIDAVSEPLGLRYFRIDPDNGFYLNGKPYRLYGVCRHQEWQDYGNALSDEQHKTDLDMIYEIGATSIRLAHYQQSEYVYANADKLGFVIWAEIPFVNTWTGQESENAKQQLIELIRQNYNHPSIFFWGLHNEVYAKNQFEYPVQLTKELHDLAKTEDSDRFDVTVGAHDTLDKPMNFHADLQGNNRYMGWYGNKATNIGPWITAIRKEHPGTPLAVSEYGAEANITQQSEDLKFDFDPVNGQFFPENYQTYFHEVYWSTIIKHPHIWASYVWNMFDFSVPRWNRGGVPARNMKGLVTYDRKIKKDAFYWYKANWSDEPVLHITEKRLKERKRANVNITVYCNLDSVELWANGKKLGLAKKGVTDVHFIWENVTLQKGSNTVKAIGLKSGMRFEDEAAWEVK